jgi:hypothetical protein
VKTIRKKYNICVVSDRCIMVFGIEKVITKIITKTIKKYYNIV